MHSAHRNARGAWPIRNGSNEGASKGILVTTGGLGKASCEFADGKPLELLSGSNLLYLLAQNTGIEAKIEMPEGRKDQILIPANDLRMPAFRRSLHFLQALIAFPLSTRLMAPAVPLMADEIRRVPD
jgi:hypothetical protein